MLTAQLSFLTLEAQTACLSSERKQRYIREGEEGGKEDSIVNLSLVIFSLMSHSICKVLHKERDYSD